MACQAVSCITDGCVITYNHSYAVLTLVQWITYVATDFLSKLSRRQGYSGIVFKSAWHVNLKKHKTRQLLGGFTMHYNFCHHVYMYIYCELVLEWRDDSACEKTIQNVPLPPHFLFVITLLPCNEIKTDTKLFWKFKLSFLIRW